MSIIKSKLAAIAAAVCFLAAIMMAGTAGGQTDPRIRPANNPWAPTECQSGIVAKRVDTNETACIPEQDPKDLPFTAGTEVELYGDYGNGSDEVAISQFDDATEQTQTKRSESSQPREIIGDGTIKCQPDLVVKGRDVPARFVTGDLMAQGFLGFKSNGYPGFGRFFCGGTQATTTTTAPSTTTTQATTTTSTTTPPPATTASTAPSTTTTAPSTTTTQATTTTKPLVPEKTHSGYGDALQKGNRGIMVCSLLVLAGVLLCIAIRPEKFGIKA